MVAPENDMIYINILGDPLKIYQTARHFFGECFEVYGEEVLVPIGKVFDAHLRLREGTYQTFTKTYGESPSPWKPITISRSGNTYKLVVSTELWCSKKPGPEHTYFPNENARILFEKYFGIR